MDQTNAVNDVTKYSGNHHHFCDLIKCSVNRPYKSLDMAHKKNLT